MPSVKLCLCIVPGRWLNLYALAHTILEADHSRFPYSVSIHKPTTQVFTPSISTASTARWILRGVHLHQSGTALTDSIVLIHMICQPRLTITLWYLLIF
ncbi:hypothetical protein P692DRAFT_20832769 [Suillus brevipes Sb2]|nr:hypothetical protein P692DRAFT_20832769 [Suillus brevipes Sb2]